MGTVTYRDGVAILQIIFCVPAFLCAIALIRRHGWSTAWWLIMMFSLARLVGAAATLYTIDNPGLGADNTILVTLYLGISPLVFMNWSMLVRVNRQVLKPLPIAIYRIISLLNMAALGFGIYGAYRASQDALTTGQNIANPYVAIALVTFTVVYALSILYFAYLTSQMRTIMARERITLLAVLIVIPLLAVRIIYALIGDFGKTKSFNPYNGDVTIYLCLDVLEELIIVYIFLITGFCLPIQSRSSNVQSDPERSSDSPSPIRKHHKSRRENQTPLDEIRRSHASHTQLQPKMNELPVKRAKTASGPVTWIYYTITDKLAQNNKN